jgi:hypothetical protein
MFELGEKYEALKAIKEVVQLHRELGRKDSTMSTRDDPSPSSLIACLI